MSMMMSDEKAMPDYLSDCRLMLRFARRNGLPISRVLQHDIASLDTVLCRLNVAPISELPTSLIQAVPAVVGTEVAKGAPIAEVATVTSEAVGDGTATAPQGSLDMASIAPVEAVIFVHGELSKVIAPASALSLQTSEPPPGRHRFLGGMPLIVKAAAMTALVSAIGFVVSAGFIAGKKSSDPAAGKAQSAVAPKPNVTASDGPEKVR
jgi:hypothetical protein